MGQSQGADRSAVEPCPARDSGWWAFQCPAAESRRPFGMQLHCSRNAAGLQLTTPHSNNYRALNMNSRLSGSIIRASACRCGARIGQKCKDQYGVPVPPHPDRQKRAANRFPSIAEALSGLSAGEPPAPSADQQKAERNRRLLESGRTATGQFSPGRSGNPRGRPRGTSGTRQQRANQLELARLMLTNTDMAPTAVAAACGFRSSRTFDKHYKRQYGKTPAGVCRHG